MAKQAKRIENAIDLDAEEIQEIFEKAFQKVVNNPKNPIQVESVDVSASKEDLGKNFLVEVTIYGLAGTTTRTQFQDKKTKKTIAGGDTIVTDLGEGRKGSAIFKLESVSDLNTNDYRLYYRMHG